MRKMQEFKATGETLAEALLDQKRRRAEKDNLEPAAGTGVFTPEALDGFWPVRRFLDLVENQQCAPPAGLAREASMRPLTNRRSSGIL